MTPRTVLATTAAAACAPYLALKAAWVCGFRPGVDHLPFPHAVWVVGNAATIGMDLAAALLARALADPRRAGRLPAPLLALPMWAATGLLSMILIDVPLAAAAVPCGAPNPFAADGDGALRPWVFAVVYSGFIAQGTALIGAYALHLRDRHGALLRTPLRALPAPGRAFRPALAGTAAVLAAVGVLRLAMASGLRAGLGPAWPSELHGIMRLLVGTLGVLALLGAAGLALAAAGRGRLAAAAGAVWVGAGGSAFCGGWVALSMSVRAGGGLWTPLTVSLCAGEAGAGIMVLCLGWTALSRWSRSVPRGAAPAAPAVR
ncbi:hypothetical protein BIV57_06990 [Mangrovactinospora gilvigrisea]|uniref:Uncharacterized protein n=1 Tax=Mangrovactinospora gilvigrisea TaxID=1428644 RepID=A0A1J7C9H6_9ACTN|nr:hypothetical protein [Mangrovactinospora gilvigrisea]OIV38184.1 hypothetical protein BIV57_06990 [Mangrovactinospora gilvigrisea]